MNYLRLFSINKFKIYAIFLPSLIHFVALYYFLIPALSLILLLFNHICKTKGARRSFQFLELDSRGQCRSKTETTVTPSRQWKDETKEQSVIGNQAQKNKRGKDTMLFVQGHIFFEYKYDYECIKKKRKAKWNRINLSGCWD